jgi:hypothetical protein
MSADIADRLLQVLTNIDKIQKDNKLVTMEKKKNKIKKEKSKLKVNELEENLDSNLVNTESDNIIMTSSPFYLPETPIPQKVLRIINLGASGLKVITNENETIFHAFYAPRGNKHIIIPENSWIDVLYLEKSGGEKIWLSK